jgi:hypothetical protein
LSPWPTFRLWAPWSLRPCCELFLGLKSKEQWWWTDKVPSELHIPLQNSLALTTTSCQCWWQCPLTKMLCLYEQAAVLPVTSTEIECSFSSMSFMKNYLRNRMAWEMNGLVICCYCTSQVTLSHPSKLLGSWESNESVVYQQKRLQNYSLLAWAFTICHTICH